MGIFSKAPKPTPKIIVEGVEIVFNRDHEWWEFTYRGNEFTSFGPKLTLPTKAELDHILDSVESLKPELKERMTRRLSEWGDPEMDIPDECVINVEDFVTERTFTVSWSDPESWGDLGVDFTIKERAIVDESWGD